MKITDNVVVWPVEGEAEQNTLLSISHIHIPSWRPAHANTYYIILGFFICYGYLTFEHGKTTQGSYADSIKLSKKQWVEDWRVRCAIPFDKSKMYGAQPRNSFFLEYDRAER